MHEQLLEVFQPHSNPKRLKIHDYDGLCFPKWISILSNLVALELWRCNNCVQLPNYTICVILSTWMTMYLMPMIIVKIHSIEAEKTCMKMFSSYCNIL